MDRLKPNSVGLVGVVFMAQLLGGIGMMVVVWLLAQNAGTAAGPAGSSWWTRRSGPYWRHDRVLTRLRAGVAGAAGTSPRRQLPRD